MITCTVEIPWADVIHLIFIGDEHIGNAAAQEDILHKVVEHVKQNEHTYAIFLGDAIDAINITDRRFDPRQCAPWLSVVDLLDIAAAEIDRYASIVRPIADRVLAACCGNHEDKLSRRYERDVYRALWDAVGVPAERRLGYGGFVQLKIRDNRYPSTQRRRSSVQAWTVTIFCHHGAGGGRLLGGTALNLERLPGRFLADIYAVGHTHKRVAFSIERVTADGPQRVVCLSVGSLLAPYHQDFGGYAEAGLMLPQDSGPIIVDLLPQERQIQLIV